MRTIPVTRPYFDDEELEQAKLALDSGWVALGPRVAEFEKKVAAHEGIAEGVATTSCTTALHLAMAGEGLTASMDAIAPSFTFVATENAIVQTGATPVIADVKQQTFNIDTEGLEKLIEEKYKSEGGKLKNKATGNTLWGIVPVHEFGLCCDILEVNKIAKKYALKVIEDAACALGASVGGVHQGAFGNTSCVSFHPRKSITTGEGGMVLTDDSALAKRLRELRAHGSSVSASDRDKGRGFLLPSFDEAGFNYRMTDIQGGIGLAQIKKLDFIIGEKRKRAAIYNQLLSAVPEFITPTEPEGYFHTYQSYVCMLDIKRLGISSVEEGGNYRNELLGRLEDKGVATRQGTHAVHMLGYYKNRFGFKAEDFPGAYACDRLSITLPLYVQMTDDDQQYVADTIRQTLDEMK